MIILFAAELLRRLSIMEDLVNVCLQPFVSSVQSSSVARDGFTAANLVAMERTAHNKGFRVEHFIRPPVSVLLEFKWPVNVACILVKPGLEVDSEIKVCFDGCHILDIDSYQYNLHHGVVARGNQSLLLLKNRSFNQKWDKKIDFKSEVVAMVQGSQVGATDVEHTTVTEQPLRHINIASRLKQLKLTVTHLTGVKPLVISWIEVWGTLSDTCSMGELAEYRTAVQNIRLSTHSSQSETNLYSHHNPYHSPDQCSGVATLSASAAHYSGPLFKPQSLVGQEIPHDLDSPRSKRRRMEERIKDMGSSPSPSNVGFTSQPMGSINMNTENNPDSINMAQSDGSISSEYNSFLGVPTKFLDAITYEIMLLPMLLPSGHYVDRSTVDKLANSDSLYGRSPTDPFTGKFQSIHLFPVAELVY